MKKQTIFILFLFLLIIPFTNSYVYEVESNILSYKESISVLEQLPGTYTSADGKTITVAEDGTTKYLDTYTLTVTQASTGNVLSGKVGTNNKGATFYQINDHIIVSATTINYTHNGATEYLYDYTVFSLQKVSETSATGIIEIWRNNSKVNSYKTLQDAVDSATAGDTIKITKDLVVTEGAYINKNITIEGNNHTLDKSKWFNPVFVVEDGVTASINNMTIDGGENTFEIDFSTTTPSIKENTTNQSVKSNTHIVISSGILNTNNLNIQNTYTVQEGSAIRILRGKANIKNGKFNHNLGNEIAVVIRTGSTLKSTDTELPVEELIVENCEFNNNYVPGGSGGAILLSNVTTTKIKNSKFYRNIVTTASSGGGAVYYDANGQRNAETLNIDYPKLFIENSTFEENYSGNDGFAVSNDSAHLYINNSTFTKNVGLHATSSVGTVSCMVDGINEYDLFVTNSLFEKNEGPVTGIGDHGTLANVKIDNTIFNGNKGNITILIYQGNGTLSNLTFKNEKNAAGILDIRTAYNSATRPKYQPNTLTLKDLLFENNNTPAEIFIRKQSHDPSMNTVTVNLEGTIRGNIDIIDGQKMNIKGTVIGNIYSEDTVSENIISELSSDKSTYNLYRYNNHYIATVYYPLSHNTESVEYLYLEKGKTYTEKEIFMMLKNHNEGYATKYYTNNTFTTPWTFTSSSNINLYGRLEEHTHEFDGTLILENNKIYEQCTLGHFGKELSLSVPKNNSYTGKEIPISVTNTINAKDYKIVYYVKENNDWKELSSVPKEEGTYKAVLTYNNMNIEQEYSIGPKNPNTAVDIKLLGTAALYIILTIIILGILSKIRIKKYNI